MFCRTAFSKFDPLGILDKTNGFEPFQADDEKLPQIAEKARLHYKSKVEEWELIATLEDEWITQCDEWWEWVFNPAGCLFLECFAVDADEAAEAYQEGLDWLSWGANDGYKVIIGAKTFDNPVITGGECWCTYVNSLPYPNTTTYYMPVPNSAECSALTNYSDTFCSWQNIISYLPIEHRSDGVVLEESAKGFPGAQVDPNFDPDDPNYVDPFELRHSNHMEMRNNGETKRVLLELFKNGFGESYWKVEKRVP